MTRGQRAVERFNSGWNCAQSVLWAFHEDLHLPAQLASRIACGFGGGMARRQEVCGAVTGGVLVLGMRHGQGEERDSAAVETTYAKTQEFFRRFEARCGSCKCRELLAGCDLMSAEGRQKMKDDLKQRICVPCVETAVAILEALEDE